jgi:hypothetical protein
MVVSARLQEPDGVDRDSRLFSQVTGSTISGRQTSTESVISSVERTPAVSVVLQSVNSLPVRGETRAGPCVGTSHG